MKKFLFLALSVISNLSVFSYDFQIGDLCYSITSISKRTVSVEASSSSLSGDVIIPSVVTYNNVDFTVDSIAANGFASCLGITSFAIPYSVKGIGSLGFGWCWDLNTIILDGPNSQFSVGSDAFNYDWRDFKTVRIINVDEKELMNNGAGLLASSSLPTHDLYINGEKVVDYKVADGVETINNCFRNCNSIETLAMPNSVKNIISSACYSCTALRTITLSSKLESIGYNAFAECPELRTIFAKSMTPPSIDASTFPNGAYMFATVYVPKGTLSAYKNANVWSEFTNIVETDYNDVPDVPQSSVTPIELSATKITLWVGKAKTITATVNPTMATKTSVTWSSSDTKVATVSSKGVVKAIGKGTCTITCEAANKHGIKAECKVTVKQPVTSIDFGYENLNLTAGTEKILTPTIYPSNADAQPFSWKSKNKSVATITSEGILKAIAPGTAQIICTATDGFKKADTITVEVVPLKITDSKPTIADGTYGIGGISYTRTLTEGRYAAFCLPYNVNLNNYTDEFAKVYVPMGMAFLKPNGTLMVMFKKVSLTETIKAGRPFVALAAKSGAVAIKNDYKKTFTSLTNPEPASLDIYNWSGSNGFLDFNPDITAKIGGNYGKLTGLDSEKYYLVSTSGAMSKAASVSPYRIYVYKDDKNSNAKVTEIIFSFDEDEMATGIENITNEQKDDDKIYNINGQRINKANAQKGIYIKNGKKYANKN